MTRKQEKLIKQYELGEISLELLLGKFGVDLEGDSEYVLSQITEAINKQDSEKLDFAIQLIWISGNYKRYLNILNQLLIIPHHWRHQEITKTIQDIGDPSSVPYIRKALESNFDYLKYTASESSAIAKWFSWALYKIGTKEAIELIREYTQSNDAGIREEMIYRLKKYNNNE